MSVGGGGVGGGGGGGDLSLSLTGAKYCCIVRGVRSEHSCSLGSQYRL